MHVFQTEGVPPNIGNIILPNIGSIQNIKPALTNKENANNMTNTEVLPVIKLD
jgi:hypothetical protein